jgi:hypothetical protein
MIRELFQRDRPLFVGFDGDQFAIGPMRRPELAGLVTDLLPLRKRFRDGRLVCHSRDGRTAANGQRCALCRDRWTCAERVRLMLLLDGLAPEPTPAVLEIGHGSFEELDRLLDRVGPDRLPTTPVRIGLQRLQGRLRFTFGTADTQAPPG